MWFIRKHKIKNKGNNKITFSKKDCRKYVVKFWGNDNKLEVENGLSCRNLEVNVKGNNNSVFIDENFKCLNSIKIYVTGNNNKIVLNKDILVVDSLIIYCHENAQNCVVDIGAQTSFYKTELFCYDDNSSVVIGEDCMFGYDTVIYNTDGHAVFQDGKLINQGKSLKIGNHVWLAQGVEILKNSLIPDGCIVGRRAVVCGRFEEKNAVLGGVPAKIVKSNIEWDRRTVNNILGSSL